MWCLGVYLHGGAEGKMAHTPNCHASQMHAVHSMRVMSSTVARVYYASYINQVWIPAYTQNASKIQNTQFRFHVFEPKQCKSM